jgi:hypothetical protein
MKALESAREPRAMLRLAIALAPMKVRQGRQAPR